MMYIKRTMDYADDNGLNKFFAKNIEKFNYKAPENIRSKHVDKIHKKIESFLNKNEGKRMTGKLFNMKIEMYKLKSKDKQMMFLFKQMMKKSKFVHNNPLDMVQHVKNAKINAPRVVIRGNKGINVRVREKQHRKNIFYVKKRDKIKKRTKRSDDEIVYIKNGNRKEKLSNSVIRKIDKMLAKYNFKSPIDRYLERILLGKADPNLLKKLQQKLSTIMADDDYESNIKRDVDALVREFKKLTQKLDKKSTSDKEIEKIKQRLDDDEKNRIKIKESEENRIKRKKESEENRIKRKKDSDEDRIKRKMQDEYVKRIEEIKKDTKTQDKLNKKDMGEIEEGAKELLKLVKKNKDDADTKELKKNYNNALITIEEMKKDNQRTETLNNDLLTLLDHQKKTSKRIETLEELLNKTDGKKEEEIEKRLKKLTKENEETDDMVKNLEEEKIKQKKKYKEKQEKMNNLALKLQQITYEDKLKRKSTIDSKLSEISSDSKSGSYKSMNNKNKATRREIRDDFIKKNRTLKYKKNVPPPIKPPPDKKSSDKKSSDKKSSDKKSSDKKSSDKKSSDKIPGTPIPEEHLAQTPVYIKKMKELVNEIFKFAEKKHTDNFKFDLNKGFLEKIREKQNLLNKSGGSYKLLINETGKIKELYANYMKQIPDKTFQQKINVLEGNDVKNLLSVYQRPDELFNFDVVNDPKKFIDIRTDEDIQNFDKKLKKLKKTSTGDKGTDSGSSSSSSHNSNGSDKIQPLKLNISPLISPKNKKSIAKGKLNPRTTDNNKTNKWTVHLAKKDTLRLEKLKKELDNKIKEENFSSTTSDEKESTRTRKIKREYREKRDKLKKTKKERREAVLDLPKAAQEIPSYDSLLGSKTDVLKEKYKKNLKQLKEKYDEKIKKYKENGNITNSKSKSTSVSAPSGDAYKAQHTEYITKRNELKEEYNAKKQTLMKKLTERIEKLKERTVKEEEKLKERMKKASERLKQLKTLPVYESNNTSKSKSSVETKNSNSKNSTKAWIERQKIKTEAKKERDELKKQAKVNRKEYRVAKVIVSKSYRSKGGTIRKITKGKPKLGRGTTSAEKSAERSVLSSIEKLKEGVSPKDPKESMEKFIKEYITDKEGSDKGKGGERKLSAIMLDIRKYYSKNAPKMRGSVIGPNIKKWYIRKIEASITQIESLQAKIYIVSISNIKKFKYIENEYNSFLAKFLKIKESEKGNIPIFELMDNYNSLAYLYYQLFFIGAIVKGIKGDTPLAQERTHSRTSQTRVIKSYNDLISIQLNKIKSIKGFRESEKKTKIITDAENLLKPTPGKDFTLLIQELMKTTIGLSILYEKNAGTNRIFLRINQTMNSKMAPDSFITLEKGSGDEVTGVKMACVKPTKAEIRPAIYKNVNRLNIWKQPLDIEISKNSLKSTFSYFNDIITNDRELEIVYKERLSNVIRDSVYTGNNVVFLAYGNSGGGKTYTIDKMLQYFTNHMNELLTTDLSELENMVSVSKITVGGVQYYNNGTDSGIYDITTTSGLTLSDVKVLKGKDTPHKTVFNYNADAFPASKPFFMDDKKYLTITKDNLDIRKSRKYGKTKSLISDKIKHMRNLTVRRNVKMNNESSRSHTVFYFNISFVYKEGDKIKKKEIMVTFVDLAGLENPSLYKITEEDLAGSTGGKKMKGDDTLASLEGDAITETLEMLEVQLKKYDKNTKTKLIPVKKDYPNNERFKKFLEFVFESSNLPKIFTFLCVQQYANKDIGGDMGLVSTSTIRKKGKGDYNATIRQEQILVRHYKCEGTFKALKMFAPKLQKSQSSSKVGQKLVPGSKVSLTHAIDPKYVLICHLVSIFLDESPRALAGRKIAPVFYAVPSFFNENFLKKNCTKLEHMKYKKFVPRKGEKQITLQDFYNANKGIIDILVAREKKK